MFRFFVIVGFFTTQGVYAGIVRKYQTSTDSDGRKLDDPVDTMNLALSDQRQPVACGRDSLPTLRSQLLKRVSESCASWSKTDSSSKNNLDRFAVALR